MKNLKVLTKLRDKARRRTVLVSVQHLHDTFTFDEQTQSCASVIFKQTVKTNPFDFYLLNFGAYVLAYKNFVMQKVNFLYVSDVKTNVVRTKAELLYKVNFLHTKHNEVFAQLCFCKQCKHCMHTMQVPDLLRNLQNITQEKQVDKGIALFNGARKNGKLCLPSLPRKVVRSVETFTSLTYSESCPRKYCLRLNTILNNRVLTLRFANTLSQKRKKHKMIRPLLDFKRESITMVCKDFRMPVYPDQSNRSVKYSRNRIRKQILPSIKYFINPQVESSLFKLAELLNKEQFFLYSILRNMSTGVPLKGSVQ